MNLPRLVVLGTTLFTSSLSHSHSACPSCETVPFNVDQNVRFNFAMEGNGIDSERHQVSSVFECFIRCQKNCLCESFNYLGSQWSGGLCVLNEADVHTDPSAIKPKNGSLFYNLHRGVPINCADCSSRLSCCASSKPCYNDGVCSDSCNEIGTRYKCKCPINYAGNRCQHYDINTP